MIARPVGKKATGLRNAERGMAEGRRALGDLSFGIWHSAAAFRTG